MDTNKQIAVEAAVFRRLVEHFRQHPEAQNIDLMILADFCRNCLAKWYAAAAQEYGENVDYEQAREIIYGMPYKEWREKFQADATPQQLAAFEERQRQKSSD